MQSELAKKLKIILDNMTQEEFDKQWNEIVERNKNITKDFQLNIFDIMKTVTIEEAKEKHDKLREILIKYGSEEYGDCIVDEISWLFGFPTTIDVEPEEEIPFTYSFLRRKLDWMEFCELTGTNEWVKNEGREFKDSDIYYITESKAKEYNLL